MNVAKLGMLWDRLKSIDESEFDMRFVSKCLAGHTCKMVDQYPSKEPSNIAQTDMVIEKASSILDLDRLQRLDLFYPTSLSDTSLDGALYTISTTYLWSLTHPLEYPTFDWKTYHE